MGKLLFLLTSTIALATLFFVAREHYFPQKYRAAVFSYAKQYELDPLLVAALVYRESKFHPQAVSCRGAVGLMQLCPSTVKELKRLKLIEEVAVDRLAQPRLNIALGTLYLSWLKKRLFATEERREKILHWYAGDATLMMLHCYHAGPTTILQKYLDNAAAKEEYEPMLTKTTKKYAQDILRLQERLAFFNKWISYE